MFQEAFGGLLGRFSIDVGILFGFIFASKLELLAKTWKMQKIAVSPRRESNFQGSGALKSGQKMLEKRLSKRSLYQERLEERLGVDF